MSTIYDVAALAQVSPATVSRVINGSSVSPEKAERVRAAAEELSFVPNRTARSLRRRSSNMIALVIPDIENPFFTVIARGVEDRAREAGYSVVLCNTDEDSTKEAAYFDIAVLEHMAGVIVAPASDASDLDRIASAGRPLVAVDRRSHDRRVDSVVIDNPAAGREATEALIAQGRRRIACITGPESVETAQLRLEGWRSSMTAHGLDTAGLERHADFRVLGGRAAMRELLALPQPPDAVVATNNMMAIGALQALHEGGIRSGDIAVASLGDLPSAPVMPENTLVIDLPARALGITAAEVLLRRIAGTESAPETIVLGTGD
ncbi:transcriptional regulator, LacI family [Paramicrobacterium humi]|uniref:Transcriptional regulator, LacI family n=1 Tax=Paramicrobacterium humi TaxID=640635 RepID=A0A1H4PLZ7_9MICO|nr:LacI family DNA-binding transcriptional regulator [Microbacterium humi]SEC08487.1 transcriptional regulator, LacI family [Microbacterium humi]